MHILLYFIFYSLYLIFYSFYFMNTSLVLYFSIFALSKERTRLSFHCWLYNLCIVVYVTNKTWNLKLEFSDFWAISYCFVQIVMLIRIQMHFVLLTTVSLLFVREGHFWIILKKGRGSSPQSPPFCTCLHPWMIPLHFHIQHMVC